MVSAIAAGVVMVVAGRSAISKVQARTSLPLPPSQEFYIQVLSDKTGSNTGYLDNTGQTHTQCHLASQWQVIDERLFSGNGDQLISVEHNVPYVRFGVVDILNASSLDHPWVLQSDGCIAWQNGSFTNGAATFGRDAHGILYAIFTGSIPGNLTSAFLQILNVEDCHDLPQASSRAPTKSAPTTALTKTSLLAKASLITTSATSASFTPNPLNCDFEISKYDGLAIVSVAYDFDEGSISTSDTDSYTCCQTCQKMAGCVYSLFDETGPGCTLTLAGGQGCSQIGYYYTSTAVNAVIVIANGTCGEILYGGDVSATVTTAKASVSPSKTVATSTSSSPPTSSVCDNGVSSIDGQAITTVTADVEGTFQNSAATPYDCCVSCQNEASCQYAEFSTESGCTLALASGQCAAGSYYTSATAAVSITLYNGTCGGVTYGGTTA